VADRSNYADDLNRYALDREQALADAMLATGDHTPRLAFADYLDENDRPGEAALLRDVSKPVRRVGGRVEEWHPPEHATDIEQVTDYHGDGTPYVRRHTVRTAHSDLSDTPWERLTDDERHHWEDVLARLHDASVRHAELPPDARWRVNDELGFLGHVDLEDLPRVYGNIVRQYEEAIRDGREPRG
jgi:uncharacterized protein (TIGR02996 family)